MTKKSLHGCAAMRARCLEICASGQRTQNQPTNQRTNLWRSVCGGCKPPMTLARTSTPFPASSILTAPTLHLSRTSSAFASLPSSSPALLPVSSSPFTDDDGVCVYRHQSPSTEDFSRFFSPRVYPTPRRVQTVGAAAVGIQRVQPSVLGLSLVSLVTAPHKGIAL